jgi:adenine phosphoribosyltransferase
MSNSDITINDLKKVGEADAEYLVSLIRSIPGFPNESVLFRDFMPVLADARGFKIMMKALELALPVPVSDFDYVAGLEARGFLIGPTLAYNLGKGFVSVRKAGKLPPDTIGESYALEYGQARIEIERGAVAAGDRVLIIDDLIATSGTAKAASDLIERAGGSVVGFSFVMELIGLNGRDSLGGKPCSSLVTMLA